METSKQQQTINALYIMLIVSTIASFVPLMLAQVLSLVLVVVVLGAAYLYKAQDKEDGLLYNHMTYMIGTIWIGTTFIILGIAVAGTWVYLKGDHSIIHNTIMQIENGAAMLDEAALQNITKDYIGANQSLLMTSSLVTIGPAILYFVYRVANGFSRSLRGYRIANPKSWL